jgi:hypothetical protein
MAILLRSLQLQEAEEADPICHRLGARESKPRQGLEGHAMLYNYYFSNDPTYNAKDFRRRYRRNRDLFMKIVHVV